MPPDGPAFDPFDEDDCLKASEVKGELASPLRLVHHQVSCLHLSQATIDYVITHDPKLKKKLDPEIDLGFHDVDTVRCTNPLVEPSLFEMNGVPFAAALQRPGNAIVLTNLNTREHGSLLLNPHVAYHNCVSPHLPCTYS